LLLFNISALSSIGESELQIANIKLKIAKSTVLLENLQFAIFNLQ